MIEQFAVRIRRASGLKERSRLRRPMQMPRKWCSIMVGCMRRILTVHASSTTQILDWHDIANQPPPVAPEYVPRHEYSARRALAEFKPSLFVTALGLAERKHQRLIRSVGEGKRKDEEEFEKNQKTYEKTLVAWEEEVRFASALISGNKRLLIDLVERKNPFESIPEIGKEVYVSLSSEAVLHAEVTVHDIKIVPEEHLALLKSGRVSVRKMSLSRRLTIYREYVCSVVVRVAVELLKLLPLDTCIVTVKASSTGLLAEEEDRQPIVSAYITRRTLFSFELKSANAVAIVKHFAHNMKFDKSKGFRGVQLVTPPLAGGSAPLSSRRAGPAERRSFRSVSDEPRDQGNG
jgi:hypothetical protein